jgi:hypothetical protein
MTVTRDIKRQQRRWADAQGIAIDQNGYVGDVSENLLKPLSAAFLSALEGAGGGELQEQRSRPAKIRALHSSAGLAINVFQHWEGSHGPVLPAALGFDSVLQSVEIERQFESGLTGMPPTLDVVLRLADGSIIAIESKFTEWMTAKRPKLDDFREKYLGAKRELWADVGLPSCQSLAEDIAAGRRQFRQLGALQLLKHALGLTVSGGRPFSLIYLYFDIDADADVAERHRVEVAELAGRLDAALGFKAMTYQQLFSGLANVGGVDSDYLDYLRVRYFAGNPYSGK